MKKIITKAALLATMLSSFAFGFTAQAVTPTWDVRGTYVWDVFGMYFHDFTIDVQNNDGTFSGYAGYPSGAAPYDQAGQTTETVTGSVTGNVISFQVVYNGPYAPGSTFNMTGTIDGNGHISGINPWNWQLTGHEAVVTDQDGDGLLNWEDFCPSGTVPDGSWDVSWGTNRLQLQADGWYQNKPAGKGKFAPAKVHETSYTYGCNGHQILDLLKAEFGSAMLGHYKFGLSSSMVEDFHKDLSDGKLDGRYFIETVTVPANKSTQSLSVNPLVIGTNYVLKARGTADAGDGITFDARYSFRTGSSTEWTDAVSTYEGYGVTLLDLFYNGTTPWGAYSSNHEYETVVAGNGSAAGFLVNDVYNPNNTGNLYVDIYGQI